MASGRSARTERTRGRPREAGGAPIAILAVVLTLVLAAGVSSRTATRLSPTAPPAGAPRSAVDAAAHDYAAAPVDPTTRVSAEAHVTATPAIGTLPGTTPSDPGPVAGPDVAGPGEREPSIVRAAEAGLARMRAPFVPAPQAVPGHAARPAEGPPRSGADGRAGRASLRLSDAGQPLRHGPPAEGGVMHIGEATLLIRSHGLTVLTDPNFLRRGEPARLGPLRTVARGADPALELDALPPIDVVVLSRLREDHFDRLSRRRLPRDVPIVAPAEARGALVAMGFSSVHALEPWASLRVERGDTVLELTATPTRTGPPGLAALLPASIGMLLAFGPSAEAPDVRIWVSGDTMVDDALMAALAPRLVGIDLALLHLGGAARLGLGGSMSADDGLRAAAALGAHVVVGLRLDDFTGRSGPASRPPVPADPAARLRTAAGPATDRPRVRSLERGEVLRIAAPRHWALAADGAATARR